RDTAYQSEVAAAHNLDGHGVCFRLIDEDFEDINISIDSLLNTVGVRPEEVDLLIDYRYVDPRDRSRTTLFISGLINAIPYLANWRNVILTGTSFPRDLSEVGANSIDTIERSEWLIWKRLAQFAGLQRTPTFGDYGVSNPEPFEADPRLIRMSANIRYTGD